MVHYGIICDKGALITKLRNVHCYFASRVSEQNVPLRSLVWECGFIDPRILDIIIESQWVKFHCIHFYSSKTSENNL
jgi:hypothetical protein